MNCETLQFNLSLFNDDELSFDEKTHLEKHLKICPLCRVKLDEFKSIQESFQSFSRPQIAENLTQSLRVIISNNLNKSKEKSTTSLTFVEYLQIRLMPYGVGVVVSCLVFAFLLNSLLATKTNNNLAKIIPKPETEIAFLETSNQPINRPVESDQFGELSSSLFASQRLAVSKESPSLNPAGALVALANTLIREDVKEDEIVLVAEVFGDGIAKISRFIELPKDRNTVKKLEIALQNDPKFAPFVPSSLDNRSDSVQIVLLMNRVDVFENETPNNSKNP